MASLRLALKASMEDLSEKKPLPSQKQKSGHKDTDAKISHKGETGSKGSKQPHSSGASTLAELSSFKLQRKISRQSDSQSVASDESGGGSVHSHTSSRKKHSGGKSAGFCIRFGGFNYLFLYYKMITLL